MMLTTADLFGEISLSSPLLFSSLPFSSLLSTFSSLPFSSLLSPSLVFSQLFLLFFSLLTACLCYLSQSSSLLSLIFYVSPLLGEHCLEDVAGKLKILLLDHSEEQLSDMVSTEWNGLNILHPGSLHVLILLQLPLFLLRLVSLFLPLLFLLPSPLLLLLPILILLLPLLPLLPSFSLFFSFSLSLSFFSYLFFSFFLRSYVILNENFYYIGREGQQ